MTIKPAHRINTVEEYYFSSKLREIAGMRAGGADVLNLGIGSPDLPPHPSVIATLHEWALRPDAHGYQGYQGRPELRLAMANWYRLYFGVSLDPEKEVLPLLGSKEGIMHISMAFINPGDRVLVPDPGYPTYSAATKLAGGIPETYDLLPENNWKPDMRALENIAPGEIKLMWLNYPHMPTGQAADLKTMETLLNWARSRNILLVNDNPYSFILNRNYLSILSLDGAREQSIELNSMSKAQNMAGWRVGMAISNPEFINHIIRFKSNMDSGMFLPVQMAAVKALELGQDWYDQLNEIYTGRKDLAAAILKAAGCTLQDNQQGLFLWGRIPDKYEDSYALSDRILRQAHVFITPGGIFGNNGNQYLRISLCSKPEVLQQGLDRIQKLKLQAS
ncbi:MAG TPA: aminotransferase class I/II-fold pyridoxal phosphate-dependent enzyme [Saprospiraceae bacterium]|nr:aminotransferase class I/II-fold pyridoxal phosphate-dependent enzyme [Saprospiraceae bacterium]HNT18810.1 aminotransferase class I/II-fold pyridoxal phosphate-dependent enzyme [Saprospiraceae bacterium]